MSTLPERVEQALKNGLHVTDLYVCDILRDTVAEVQRLAQEQRAILHSLQARLQPVGSPPPGGVTILAEWITATALERIDQLQQQVAEAKSDFDSFAEHHRATEQQCQAEKMRADTAERQREALRAYAQHKPPCCAGYTGSHAKCTCGLSVLLSPPAAPPPTEGAT